MADKTGIEWTDATWNPIVGCSILSPGCTNCYAMKMAGRIERMKSSHYNGTTQASKAGSVWTGKLALAPEGILTQPLRWARSRRIFVNSMGDLFHEDVPDAWIDRVFAVMALCPQHTFQVLTKRSARMRAYCGDPNTIFRVWTTVCDMVVDRQMADVSDGLLRDVVLIAPGVDPTRAPPGRRLHLHTWPLPNVWLGVSAEDQRRADERVPDLLATPAAVRFVSAEPLLGPIDFDAAWSGESALGPECWGDCSWCKNGFPPLHNCQRGLGDWEKGRSGLDWIIVGGESGPGARPMHPDWARSIRDQCASADVPFFFKQWGEWAPGEICGPNARTIKAATWFDERWLFENEPPSRPDDHIDDEPDVFWTGKVRAGRLLDGIEHNGMPGRPA